MTITFFIFSFMLLLFYLQFLFGAAALHIPLCINGIFYISIAFSWRRGIFWALLCGISLDLLYSREFYTAAMAFTATVLYAEYWLRNNDSRYLQNCLLPGGILALFSVFPMWIYKIIYYYGAVDVVFKEILPVTIFAMAVNTLVLPLLVMLLDGVGAKIRLPSFAGAGKRFLAEGKF